MRIPNGAALAFCVFALAPVPAMQAQTIHSIAGCQILPANNVWNTPVDNLPVDPNSATYVANVGASANLFPDFELYINTVDATQPRVPVAVVGIPTVSDPGPYPIPPNAVVQQASDGHMLLLDSGNCKAYEMWQAAPPSGGSWTAGTAAVFDLNSNVLRPGGWFSANAAGVAYLPGLVTYDEVMSGEITHAIGMTVPYTQQNSYLWPARMWASNVNSPQYPRFGQRFRLKASFDVSPYPFEVQVILNALKKYGAIVDDNGAAWFLNGAWDSRWNNNNVFTITGVLGSNMEVVDESSLMVEANSQVVVGSPLALDGIYIVPREVSAGAVVNAEVILTAPAPAGGATVSLSLSSPGVLGIPSSVTVPSGAVSAAIPVTANNIGLTTPVTINGTYQGVSVRSAVLLVDGATGVAAPRLSAFSITPTTAAGGASVSATITLTSAAGAGGTAVTLASSNNSVMPVPATVTVPSGALTATLALPAGSASASTAVSVTAALFGESLTVPLTITAGSGTPAPTPTPTPTPPPTPTPGAALVLVNAGGPAYTDPSGNTWSADTGFSGGNTSNTSANIAGTNTPTLYQSSRWGALSYGFSVPNGSYTVTLKFAEIYFTTPGSRVFNASINGTPVLSNFDIVVQAGAFTALDKSFPVTVTNGQVVIQFSQGSADWPLVAAISIASAGTSTPTPTPTPTPSAAVVLVNAGGPAYTDPSGNTWSTDYGFSGGNTSNTSANIAGTSTPALYQSGRWGAFTYSFSLPNGSYTVTLKFAEIYFTAAGSRVFNVAINGTPVLSNFDITAQAGAFTALDKSFPVTVTNGQVAIQFSQGTADWPLVAAISITSTTTTTPPPSTVPLALVNAGGPGYTDPSGNTWSADTDFSGGDTSNTSANIAGTNSPVLYQSGRWGAFTYNFAVANGSHTVTLKFAEIYFTSGGSRVFNVAINGAPVLSNFDITAQAGAFTALDKSFPVTVTNGQIAIQFSQGPADWPLVSAIEIQ